MSSGGYEITIDPKLFNIDVLTDWLVENVGRDNYYFALSYYYYKLVLSDEDAMAFKLKWM